ncbi:hypothetical protein RDSD_002030 [Oleidesulfovibrio alaskensis]
MIRIAANVNIKAFQQARKPDHPVIFFCTHLRIEATSRSKAG